MNTSGMETILNGLLSAQGSTTERLAAIAEIYGQSDSETRLAMALQLARVAITSGEALRAVSGQSPAR